MRPADDADIPFLWALFATDEVSYRWVYRGRIPTPESIRMNLQRPDVLGHIIEDTRGQKQLGYVGAFDVNDRNGHAQLGTVVGPDQQQTGVGVTATMLFADYLFTILPLRKLYLQSLDYNYAQFSSLVSRGYASVEGVLREHEFFAGRYWDIHVLSVTREQFKLASERMRLRER
ncbi:GNAT family N-acetyltransferase [Yinghuangia soli]|uniref:GNAT family N-acetyltransferase n=1 Tax=Yinghuangia soli TaxID=2908204 RepID=A0AA41PU75_9ACTN|nr:GNAT family protein [Yinghuangia soli]MCF2525813.1 GNAT family N-acetyltransferase [Yinghuangia soli]